MFQQVIKKNSSQFFDQKKLKMILSRVEKKTWTKLAEVINSFKRMQATSIVVN